MALLEKSVNTLQLSAKMLLCLFVSSVLGQGVVNLQEDRDLTGCSVAMQSYIWNLNGLKKTSNR